MLAGRDLTLTAGSALRVIAAKEAVSVRAHTGALEVLAERALTGTSSNGNVKIQSKRDILLASGGGCIKLAGADIDIHCPAAVSVKGVTRDFLGAGGMVANLPTLPNTQVHPFNEHFHVEDQVTGKKLDSLPYRAHRSSTGADFKAATDGNGKTHLVGTEESADDLHLFYSGDDEVKHGWA